jgi:2-polyprenyl-3-methyl-5-hydroxy-6-metoxy-1,4-benzoquinol methylase
MSYTRAERSSVANALVAGDLYPAAVSEVAAVAANRANWDERVPAHLIAYGVEEFISDGSRISGVVSDDLPLIAPWLPGGSPAGLRLVHLQCHIGLDTLSWARLGADVTGVDFSPASIAAARDIAARAGLAATFVESEIGAAADALSAQFDVVYTGVGALPWIPDPSQWARAVAALLRPGGLFHVRDAHPMLNAVDEDSPGEDLRLGRPYFGTGTPLRYEDGTTYADAEVRLTNAVTYEWPYSLSEIVQALLDAGLTLVALREHRTIPWRALPQLAPTSGGWALPTDGGRLPLMFSATATKS